MRPLSLVRLTLVVAFLCSLGLHASAAPTIRFDKNTLDIGTVNAGEKTKLSFSFQNTGDETLSITSVNASCGCTDAKAASKTVEPGKTGSIDAVFDSTGFEGKVTKEIFVTTNDPEHSSLTLIVKGEVVPIASLKPERLNFGTVKPGTKIEKTVVVTPRKPFKITKVQSDGKRVTVPDFRKARDKKGIYKLRVVVNVGDVPGRVMERVRLITDLPGNPAVEFLVFGNVQSGNVSNATPS